MENISKKVLVTGCSGQDGSYMVDYLLANTDHLVFGMVRRTAKPDYGNIAQALNNPRFKLVIGDLSDTTSIDNLVREICPDYFINLAAQSVSKHELLPVSYGYDQQNGGLKIDHVTLEELWKRRVAEGCHSRIVYDNQGIKTEVIDLPQNKAIKTLGYWNGMGMWFPIRQLSRHHYKGNLIQLNQKFGSVSVTPNHSVLDTQNTICSPLSNPDLLCIRKLGYRKRGIKTIKVSLDKRLGFSSSTHSLSSLHHSLFVNFSGERLKALCRVIGAFVTEGHISHNKHNGGYVFVISNTNKTWLESLQQDISTFCDAPANYTHSDQDGHKRCYNLNYSSKLLFHLFKKLCGGKCSDKQLPYWIYQLEEEYVNILLEKMIEGDGCYEKFGRSGVRLRYGTSSYRLACQFSLLLTLLNIDYTVGHEFLDSGRWMYQFRSCDSYQPEQGSRTKKINSIPYDDYVYDIAVDKVSNFTVGVGNIVVHNSFVGSSWTLVEQTLDVTGMGVARVLEAVRKHVPHCRVYSAGSSEQWGDVAYSPQDEDHPMRPRSPYGCAKCLAAHLVKVYRESYGLYAVHGVLANHESERRGEEFLTRKITLGVARIARARKDGQPFEPIYLGNLSARRDWSHAEDFIDGIWRMLNQDFYREVPAIGFCNKLAKSQWLAHNHIKEYVLASGQTYSVREFAEKAFAQAGIRGVWWDSGLKGNPQDEVYLLADERGLATKKAIPLIKIDPQFYRPAEVELLCGNASRARTELGWTPRVSFDRLVERMVKSDLRAVGITLE